MTILLEKETALDIGIEYEQIARQVICAALDYADCPYECEINILLSDNTGIQRINKQMRNMDMPTDVLSFPMIEFEREGDFSVVEKDVPSNFDADSGELILGDIMISLEKVVTQAEEFNHSIKREFAFLLAHSMLHLFGYDHVTDREQERMEQMQEEILQGIG
ncbi:MAG: rRNA maturation RNase YbeY, partial [Lachnospiraceae bacterium]|nr:rRNA maturation RNase YbeY [Lachnospiraceae bacterium]